MKKTLLLGFMALMVVFVGAQTTSAQFGYGGGSTSSGGSAPCPYGYNFGTFSCNPAPIVTAPVGQVLGAAIFAFTGQLNRGDHSDAVYQLQERLRADGFFTYPTSTGYFGPITFAALQAWQKAHGLSVTGSVDSFTIAALNAEALADNNSCPAGFSCTPRSPSNCPAGFTCTLIK